MSEINISPLSVADIPRKLIIIEYMRHTQNIVLDFISFVAERSPSRAESE